MEKSSYFIRPSVILHKQHSLTHSTQSCSYSSRILCGSLKNLDFLHFLNLESQFNSKAVAGISLIHPISFPSYRKVKSRRKSIAQRSSIMSKMIEEETSLNSEARTGKMVFQPILEEGVFRFDCSAAGRNCAFPSISFKNPKVRETPLLNVQKLPTFIPIFECVQGQQMVNLEFPLNTSFYGTGEVSGQLERTGKRIFTWNTDAWGYGEGTTSLYQSHPWILGVLPSGEAIGVLADTTQRCEIDLRKESNVKLISTGPFPIITFGPFASPTDVLASFSRAVGNMHSA